MKERYFYIIVIVCVLMLMGFSKLVGSTYQIEYKISETCKSDRVCERHYNTLIRELIENPEKYTQQEEQEQVDPVETILVDVYTQSYELFHEDNLMFRNDENIISLKGEYINYTELDNIVFIPDSFRKEHNLKSGDILIIDDLEYTIIDNHSNCGIDCVEILTNEYYLEEKEIIKGE